MWSMIMDGPVTFKKRAAFARPLEGMQRMLVLAAAVLAAGAFSPQGLVRCAVSVRLLDAGPFALASWLLLHGAPRKAPYAACAQ